MTAKSFFYVSLDYFPLSVEILLYSVLFTSKISGLLVLLILFFSCFDSVVFSKKLKTVAASTVPLTQKAMQKVYVRMTVIYEKYLPVSMYLVVLFVLFWGSFVTIIFIVITTPLSSSRSRSSSRSSSSCIVVVVVVISRNLER